MTEKELIEKLAHFEHESWSHWMHYLFSKCFKSNSLVAGLVIPAELVERWKKQADTEYVDLSEKEKESDRIEVRKILPIINEYAQSEE